MTPFRLKLPGSRDRAAADQLARCVLYPSEHIGFIGKPDEADLVAAGAENCSTVDFTLMTATGSEPCGNSGIPPYWRRDATANVFAAGRVRERAAMNQCNTGKSVRFEIAEATREPAAIARAA